MLDLSPNPKHNPNPYATPFPNSNVNTLTLTSLAEDELTWGLATLWSDNTTD